MKKILLFSLILGLLIIPQAAHAANPPSGITVSPYLNNIAIDPNEPTTSFNVSVTNNTNYSQTLHFSIADFGSLDETGGVAFAGSSNSSFTKKYGLSSWLSLNSNDLTLMPEQTTTIATTIKNSTSLTPGGHYGAILISTKAVGKLGKNNVGLQQTVTSLILADKLGGDHYDLKLAGITQNGNLFHPPTKITLRFYNPGNVHVIPRGVVKLLQGNTTISQGVINEDSNYVLPGTYRQIFVDMHKVSTVPTVRLVNTYKLEVSYRYDGYNQFATKTYIIRLISGWTIGLGVLIISLVIAGAYWLFKRRARLKAFQKEFQKQWQTMYARITFVRPMKKKIKKKIPVKIKDK